MSLRTICGVVAGAGLLLAALPGAAVAASGAAAPTASHTASAAAGKIFTQPLAKGCKGSSGTDTGTAITSQEFTDFPGDFSEIADDFKCTGKKKQRTVKKLTWMGQYFNGTGPADSFNFRVYANDTSGSVDEPGKMTCEWLAQSYTATGSPVITFHSDLVGDKCTLAKKTTYWLSIQSVQNFGTSGQFGWENIAETNGNEADFLESGIFSTPCTTWANDLTLVDCTAFPGDVIFSFN